MKRQVPSRKLSYKEMRRLLYGRSLQFSAGSTTQPQMKNSVAAICNTEKRKALKAIADSESDGNIGPKLMLQHFRDCMNPSGWYSIPADLFSKCQLRPLEQALTTAGPTRADAGISFLPHNTEAGAQLTICDMEDARKADPKPLPFLMLTDESAEDSERVVHGSACSTDALVPLTKGKQVVPKDMFSLEMVDFASGESGLIAFRVSDTRPSRKKRPLSFADDLGTDDLCLRLYKVESASEDELVVSALQHSEVPLAKLFQRNAGEFVNNMYQWGKASGVKHVLLLQQSALGEKAFELVQDVYQAGAVFGSSTHFDTAGLDASDDALVQTLLGQSVFVRTKVSQDNCSVQLSPWTMSSQLVLTDKQAAFQTRPGSSFDLRRINLKSGFRPTQWELFVFLQERGWQRSTWTGRAKQLKASFYKPGMDKTYFNDGYWYWLALLNSESLHALGFTLYHGQLESFYNTAITLALTDPDRVPHVKPGQAASSYKAMTGAGPSDKAQAGFVLQIVDDGMDTAGGSKDQEEAGLGLVQCFGLQDSNFAGPGPDANQHMQEVRFVTCLPWMCQDLEDADSAGGPGQPMGPNKEAQAATCSVGLRLWQDSGPQQDQGGDNAGGQPADEAGFLCQSLLQSIQYTVEMRE